MGDFEWLERIFGDNFSRAKTIKLQEDVDAHNVRFSNFWESEICWTELVNPATKEVVEGKVYFPLGTAPSSVILVCPGYRGDFVLQERAYVKKLVFTEAAFIFLRHNAIRIEGNDVQNYIHCPEKVGWAKEHKQGYLGSGKPFSYTGASREVLTALRALAIENVEKIHIIGHSWGGRIAPLSLAQLAQEEACVPIDKKLKTLTVLGPWWETREEVLTSDGLRELIDGDVEENYFKDMDGERFVADLLSTAQEIKKVTAADLPQHLELSVIWAPGDEYDPDFESMQAEIMPVMSQLEALEHQQLIVLPSLRHFKLAEIGGRNTDTHDYATSYVRDIVGRIIDSSA